MWEYENRKLKDVGGASNEEPVRDFSIEELRI